MIQPMNSFKSSSDGLCKAHSYSSQSSVERGNFKMAARVVNKQISGTKRTDYPARMAGRTAEVRAVGAWVQPEPVRVHRYYEAVVGYPIICLQFGKFSSHNLFCFRIASKNSHIHRYK